MGQDILVKYMHFLLSVLSTAYSITKNIFTLCLKVKILGTSPSVLEDHWHLCGSVVCMWCTEGGIHKPTGDITRGGMKELCIKKVPQCMVIYHNHIWWGINFISPELTYIIIPLQGHIIAIINYSLLPPLISWELAYKVALDWIQFAFMVDLLGNYATLENRVLHHELMA